MELNGFHNYTVHILKPQNNEIGEPELKKVWEKPQDKNAIITQAGMASKKTHSGG